MIAKCNLALVSSTLLKISVLVTHIKNLFPGLSSLSQLIPASALWWRMTGSNRRPSACKADALPAELIPLCLLRVRLPALRGARSVAVPYVLPPSLRSGRLASQTLATTSCLLRLLLATLSPVSSWWVWLASNQRPPRYQHGALTN